MTTKPEWHPNVTRPESHVTFFGKKFQTKIITHFGFRRVVKFDNKTHEVVKDETKLTKNHVKDCPWCVQ